MLCCYSNHDISGRLLDFEAAAPFRSGGVEVWRDGVIEGWMDAALIAMGVFLRLTGYSSSFSVSSSVPSECDPLIFDSFQYARCHGTLWYSEQKRLDT